MMNKIGYRNGLLRRVICIALAFCFVGTMGCAEGCAHTNTDRSTIETYESIAGNNSVHELVCWMQTICLDCLDISEERLFSQEEPHQFEEDGSVLTCKWCEYQTTAEAARATSKPPAVLDIKYDALLSASVGDYITFGTYEQDNNTSNGEENIEWLVLSKGYNCLLVISRYALDCKPYNMKYTSMTWETCTLRTWLNKDFLNAAFNSTEQAMISTVRVYADKNPSCSTDPGKSTRDKVFLLSINEANRYFKTDSARQCKHTAYAEAQDAYTDRNGRCCWWLRSPGNGQAFAAYVDFDGSIYGSGIAVYDDSNAVRPALWIRY